MKRFSFSEILTIIIVASASVAVILGLGLWTGYLSAEKEKESLRKAIQEVVDKDGVDTLLEMAGIPVDQVYYGEELIPLFQSKDGAWTYTPDEMRNIAV